MTTLLWAAIAAAAAYFSTARTGRGKPWLVAVLTGLAIYALLTLFCLLPAGT